MSFKVLSSSMPSESNEYLHIELGKHQFGNFSMAVLKSKEREAQSQLQSGSIRLGEDGPFGTFIGIYDGHSGLDASVFAREKLFGILQGHITSGGMSEAALDNSILDLENQFLGLVRKSLPHMLLPGTCCVVGVVCEGRIFIANIGDSRAVMGTLDKPKKQVQAVFKQMAMPKKGIQSFNLTVIHSNGKFSGINDFRTQHLGHPVTRRHFQVKDYIRTSRILGCAFLKSQEFNKCPGLSESLRLHEDISFPVVTPDPWIHSAVLKPENKFIIFATHGLWDYIDEKKAVEIVYCSPQHGIARLLINHALKKKAALANRNLQNQEAASSRSIQEEISVFVLFLDHQKLTSNNSSSECPRIGIRTYGASSFQPSPDEASSSNTKEASDTKGASGNLWERLGSSFRKFTYLWIP